MAENISAFAEKVSVDLRVGEASDQFHSLAPVEVSVPAEQSVAAHEAKADAALAQKLGFNEKPGRLAPPALVDLRATHAAARVLNKWSDGSLLTDDEFAAGVARVATLAFG
jgi:hypothetical protein